MGRKQKQARKEPRRGKNDLFGYLELNLVPLNTKIIIAILPLNKRLKGDKLDERICYKLQKGIKSFVILTTLSNGLRIWTPVSAWVIICTVNW